MELSPDELIITTEPKPVDKQVEKQVVPASVRQMQMSNPFLAPDFSNLTAAPAKVNRLGNWELIEPLFRSFEYGAGGGAATMDLPEATTLRTRGDLEMMRHQARFVEEVRKGHRTFLLADEPGLGKTAQALLAAEASNSYPLLVVVPNVVKTNWAREVELWTPGRTATVVHGDGKDVDAFSDVVIVNYEILDRHVGWLGRFGFKGMVVDEAHFIKNLKSERSKHVLALSKSIRATSPRALMMALTGTPLINSIEDFRAIWQFLGWIDDKKPLPQLMEKLEDTGLTPADFGFFAEARRAVVDMGIVRRKKVDVAADIPARRVADIPVELDDDLGRSIRARRRPSRPASSTGSAACATSSPTSATTRSFASWPTPSSRSRRARRPARTSSRWSAASARRRRLSPRTTPRSSPGRSARSCSSPSTSTSWMSAEEHFAKVGPQVPSRSAATRAPRPASRRSTRSPTTPRSRSWWPRSPRPASASTCRPPRTSFSPSSAGRAPSRPRPSTACTASARSCPVTAWRIIAAHTIDARIAELIDSKAGLAARALDGSDEEVAAESNIQLEALSSLLRDAITPRKGSE